jgi:hypothetical protein
LKGARKPCHKYHVLGKQRPYPYQDLSTMVVDNFLHRINLSVQRKTHQNPEGMTGNHDENIAPGHPSVFEKCL